jgi:hypothetical protein
MKIKVRCTFEIEVEIPEGETAESMKFRIEENGCPGTGIVGAAFDQVYADADEGSHCWACNLQGKNEIVGSA